VLEVGVAAIETIHRNMHIIVKINNLVEMCKYYSQNSFLKNLIKLDESKIFLLISLYPSLKNNTIKL